MMKNDVAVADLGEAFKKKLHKKHIITLFTQSKYVVQTFLTTVRSTVKRFFSWLGSCIFFESIAQVCQRATIEKGKDFCD